MQISLFVYKHSDNHLACCAATMGRTFEINCRNLLPTRVVARAVDCTNGMELSVCLPPQVPDSLRKCDLQKLSQSTLHEYFYIDKDQPSSSLSGNALKCNKPLSKYEQLFVFPHVLVTNTREAAKEAISSKTDLLLQAEESLRASLRQGMDEPWAEHEAVMVDTLAGVCGLPHEVAAAALVQSDYDMISAIILTDDYRDHGASSSAGWKKIGEIPSDFMSAMVNANPSMEQLSPTSWRGLFECHQRSESQEDAADCNDSVLCGKYKWSESEEDEAVTVTVRAPAGVTKRDIVSTLSPTQWTLRIKGEEEPLISGSLWGVVMPDESFWTIDKENIVMTLQKREFSGKWERLIQGELHLKQELVSAYSVWPNYVFCIQGWGRLGGVGQVGGVGV